MPTITSLLDTDLYKLTMQAAVLENFPDAEVEYGFTNRSTGKKLTAEAVAWIEHEIQALGDLRFTGSDIEYLEKAVFPDRCAAYLEYLKTFKLEPQHQIKCVFDEQTRDFNVLIKGLWKEVILYEIPVLALVSEAYFRFVDIDWTYDNQLERAQEKTKQLLESGCTFSEFGTRRRRSVETQRIVIEGIVSAAKALDKIDMITGTSNVMFAKQFSLKPIGTVAHEWMMGIAAITQDYQHVSEQCMALWIKTMGPKYAGYALTDTFGTDVFLRAFVKPYTDYYAGVRQDSGDPVEYTKLVADHYRKLGYAPMSKSIIYSDSLNVDKCRIYKAAAEQYSLRPTFGIGTFFTNDFARASDPSQKSEPLNIVIKLSQGSGHPAIKLSDNIGKNTGDSEMVHHVKEELGYVERQWAEGNESKRW